MRVKIIPLVVCSLGAIPKQFGNRLRETGITAEIREVQKTVLLGTASSLSYKITASVTKSSHQDCGLCYLHLPIFS